MSAISAISNLVAQSISDPRQAARRLIGMKLSNDMLLTAFLLVLVLNAIAYGIGQFTHPMTAPEELAPILQSPVSFMALLGASLAAMAVALTYAGRIVGGVARLRDMALLLIWLQALRVLVQAALVVVMPVSAGLAALVTFVASAIGVWIMIHFVDTAHALNSLAKSAFVLIFGALAMAIAVSILLSILGIPPMESPAHV